MKPMKPMEAMKPMAPPDSSWWPKGLSDPSSSGQQDGMRYAFFPAQRRLAVERDGRLAQYETGDHRITGVSQTGGSAPGGATFTSQNGEVDLSTLKRAD
ncbi:MULTISPECIES: hypothetical protein [unclassified Variovorax]|uniref:hypothetical protein n=1 Tax=unclassified Variovorax TaxID=663243 RepID=UPI00210DE211|nr:MULTISPECIES: hypothetical protein [unclassified Variovorax]